MKALVRYLATLSTGRLILWCYFIWYLVVLVRYFEPNPRIWLTAVGISLIIGSALLINATRSGSKPVKLERWPAIRLFIFPFCVSSFSALVKDRKFVLIFSPNWGEMLVALGLCAALWITVLSLRKIEDVRRRAQASESLTTIPESR
jgi:hypothetical protein